LPSNYTGVVPGGVYQSSLTNAFQHNAPFDDFAPRIGFAWQPLSTNKLVIRGGAGFFYDTISGQYLARDGVVEEPCAASNNELVRRQRLPRETNTRSEIVEGGIVLERIGQTTLVDPTGDHAGVIARQ